MDTWRRDGLAASFAILWLEIEQLKQRRLSPGAMKVARNTAAQAGTQVLLMPLSVIFVMFVARALGPEGYGIYQLALSFPALLATAVPLGMNIYFSRDIAQRPEEARRYASHGFSLVFFSGAIVYLLIEVTATSLGLPVEARLPIAVSGLAAVISAGTLLSSSFFRAFERLEIDASLTFGERLAAVALGLATLLIWKTPLALVCVLLATALGKLIASQVLLGRQIGSFPLRVEGKESLSFVREGWPFLIGGYCATFYDNIGLTVLAKVSSATEVGTYAAAWRLVALVNAVAIAFNNAALPLLARKALGGRASVKEILQAALPPLAFGAGATASFVALIAEPLSSFLYGHQFTGVPATLAILAYSVPSVFVKYFLGNTLMSLGEQPYITKILLGAACLSLPLNLLLGSLYGPNGAALALLVIEYSVSVGLLFRIAHIGAGRHLPLTLASWSLGALPGIVVSRLPITLAQQAVIVILALAVAGYLGRSQFRQCLALVAVRNV